jgi:hypothetical protein
MKTDPSNSLGRNLLPKYKKRNMTNYILQPQRILLTRNSLFCEGMGYTICFPRRINNTRGSKHNQFLLNAFYKMPKPAGMRRGRLNFFHNLKCISFEYHVKKANLFAKNHCMSCCHRFSHRRIGFYRTKQTFCTQKHTFTITATITIPTQPCFLLTVASQFTLTTPTGVRFHVLTALGAKSSTTSCICW